jgi:hypothetical protein
MNDSNRCYICQGFFMPGQNVDHKRKGKRVIWYHTGCMLTPMGLALLGK